MPTCMYVYYVQGWWHEGRGLITWVHVRKHRQVVDVIVDNDLQHTPRCTRTCGQRQPMYSHFAKTGWIGRECRVDMQGHEDWLYWGRGADDNAGLRNRMMRAFGKDVLRWRKQYAWPLNLAS